MPCFHPSRVEVRRKSFVSSNRIAYVQVVPCGSCSGCRAEQARQWAVRMMHEARMHDFAWFLTLTYAEEHLPENGSLCPADLRSFVRDLRREYPPRSVSYFTCGEYGEVTQRPHYHAVLFGVPFVDRYVDNLCGRPQVWRSSGLERIWGRGICEFSPVTMGSASYVAGYVTKKLASQGDYVAEDTGECLVRPFARMSLKPAIGRRWIEKYWTDVYPRDFVVVDGVESKPPRYYDKWMDKYHPDVMETVRVKRYEEMVELGPRELDAAERVYNARRKLFASRGAV